MKIVSDIVCNKNYKKKKTHFSKVKQKLLHFTTVSVFPTLLFAKSDRNLGRDLIKLLEA